MSHGKQPIIALYFESETVLKFYNLEAWSQIEKDVIIPGSILLCMLKTHLISLFDYHYIAHALLLYNCLLQPISYSLFSYYSIADYNALIFKNSYNLYLYSLYDKRYDFNFFAILKRHVCKSNLITKILAEI